MGCAAAAGKGIQGEEEDDEVMHVDADDACCGYDPPAYCHQPEFLHLRMREYYPQVSESRQSAVMTTARQAGKRWLTWHAYLSWCVMADDILPGERGPRDRRDQARTTAHLRRRRRGPCGERASHPPGVCVQAGSGVQQGREGGHAWPERTVDSRVCVLFVASCGLTTSRRRCIKA